MDNSMERSMNASRLWICLGAGFLFLMLNGCESPDGPPFMPQAAKNPENGRAFIYWPGQRWREKAGQYPEVQLDGVPVGVLRYKTYLEVEMPPGKHEFRVTAFSEAAKWNVDDKFFTTSIEPGETLYVRLFVQFDQKKNNLSNGLMKYVVQFLPKAEAQARMEMQDLRELED